MCIRDSYKITGRKAEKLKSFVAKKGVGISEKGKAKKISGRAGSYSVVIGITADNNAGSICRCLLYTSRCV